MEQTKCRAAPGYLGALLGIALRAIGEIARLALMSRPAPGRRVAAEYPAATTVESWAERDPLQSRVNVVAILISTDPTPYQERTGQVVTRRGPTPRSAPGLNPIHAYPMAEPLPLPEVRMIPADPASPDGGPARGWPEGYAS